ncbi:D-glycero-beta-D-manno-heptose-7-phosphate kinase [bacterium]|nr:D-glycero-beta-D-manno-heptose-7-phosphate kinase [bacterium]
MITRERLKEVLSRFPKCELGVIGDIMLDEFLWGKVDRISPEAPVPIVQVKSETWRPGGAANVAFNLVALGAKTHIFGIVGNDGAGRKLRELLDAEKIQTQGLIIDSGRKTTVKTRIIGQNQQMIRIDRENTEPADFQGQKALGELIWKILPSIGGIVVSDYSKGVIVEDLLSQIIKKFKKKDKFVIIDPKLKNFPLYKGATIITPNTHEAELALGRIFESGEDVLKAGIDLLKQCHTDAILITRGEQGMSLFERGKHPITIPTRALKVFDVTGAGDTVIATFSLALQAGCTMPEAAEIANLAAGVVVGIVGTAVATPKSMLEHFDQIHASPPNDCENNKIPE